MKRFLPVLLALALVICLLPVGASAASVGFELDDSTNAIANAYWSTVDLYSIFNSGDTGIMYMTYVDDKSLFYGLRSMGDGNALHWCDRSHIDPYTSVDYPLGVLDDVVGYAYSTAMSLYQNYDYAYASWVSYTKKQSIYFLTPDTYFYLPDVSADVYLGYLANCGMIDSAGIVSYDNIFPLSTHGYSYPVRGLYPTGYDPDDSSTIVLPIVGVNVSGSDTVELGRTAQYQANVYGSGEYDTAVTWALGSQTTSSGTGIDSNGLLTVADNETASYITIRATSVQDPTISGALTVSVVAASEDPTEPTQEPEATDPTSPTGDSSDDGSDDGFVWYGDAYLPDLSSFLLTYAPFVTILEFSQEIQDYYLLELGVSLTHTAILSSEPFYYDYSAGCLICDDTIGTLNLVLFDGVWVCDDNFSFYRELIHQFWGPESYFVWANYPIESRSGSGDQLSGIQDSIDGIGDQIGGVQDQLDDLPGEITDGFSDVLDDKESQAESQGNQAASDLLDQIPDPSADFISAMGSLISVMQYDGTACVLTTPDIYIPAVDGLFGQIDLLDSQQIDFEIYFALIPDVWITLIRALFDIALVSYCLKELLGLIGAFATGFQQTDFSLED